MLVTIAAIVWSSTGIFMRLFDTELWTMQAWRSVFGALVLGVVLWYLAGPRPVRSATTAASG